MMNDLSDFNFYAAYVAYSKAWNENPNKARIELNKIMLSLVENKEYHTFYRKISQYRKDLSSDYSRRVKFKAKKKRAWRKSEAKKIRLSRHKK